MRIPGCIGACRCDVNDKEWAQIPPLKNTENIKILSTVRIVGQKDIG